MMEVDMNMTRMAVGLVLAAAAAFFGRPLTWLTGLLGKRLGKYAPQWLRILGGGFRKPLILLIRYALLAAAVLVFPLPVETAKLTVWLIPVSRAVGVALLCWGLWNTAPICQLLLRSVEGTMDVSSGKTIGRFFENIYKAVVALFAALSVLDLLGLPVGSLIAGAGVAGLAVSLAAQSTLSNLIAGVTLVLEHPFGIGDYVTLGGVEGTVEDISFRSTRLRTPDKVLITVENAKVCAEYILNNSNRTSRLWSFDLNLGYDTPPEALAKVIGEVEAVLRADKQIQGDTVQVIVDRFEPSAVVLNVRCYADTAVFAEYRALKDRLNRSIMETVTACGCRFALPASRVYMEGKREGTKDEE